MALESGLVTQAVIKCISVACPGVTHEKIRGDVELVQGLGIDSMRMLELQAELEQQLQLEDFPLQDWVDREHLAGRAMTVQRLISLCVEAMQLREPSASSEGAHDKRREEVTDGSA